MKIKLIRGASYAGRLGQASRDAPFMFVDDAAGAQLIASGYFAEVPDCAHEHEDVPIEPPIITSYAAMTKAQLIKAAREKELPLTGRETKNVLVNMLNATIEPPIEGPEVDVFTDGGAV